MMLERCHTSQRVPSALDKSSASSRRDDSRNLNAAVSRRSAAPQNPDGQYPLSKTSAVEAGPGPEPRDRSDGDSGCHADVASPFSRSACTRGMDAELPRAVVCSGYGQSPY